MLSEDIRHPERQPNLFERKQDKTDENRDERLRDGDSSWGGSCEEGEVSTQ